MVVEKLVGGGWSMREREMCVCEKGTEGRGDGRRQDRL